jgi:ankyrin repeat protein
MRSEAFGRRALAWAGVSLACAACSRDVSDVAQDGAEAVRAALEASSDPDRPNKDGDSMIHVAVRRKDPRMLGVVIARGVQIDRRNRSGMTALGLAADKGCLPCALELLEARADPNAAQGVHRDLPLHRAAAAGSPELLAMLLDVGADPNGRNRLGETPLHAAASADDDQGTAVATILLARGADPHAIDALGETPVHKAAEHDSASLLTYYAGIGADLGARNAWGATPLDRAIEGHNDHATEVLYRLGAGVSWPRRFEPPLLTAARTDDVDRARSLLAFGADPLRTFQGQSATDVARDSGSARVLAVLMGAPARP